MKHFIIPLAVCCMAASGCMRTSSPADKSIPVGVIEIQGRQQAYTRSYLGKVTSDNVQIILSPHNGTVERLDVKVGQRVSDGQRLVLLNAPNVSSMYKSSQATLRQARDGYERAKKVYEGGGLSEIKWMEVQTKLTQAESAAEISQKSMDDCNVTAPFTGTVSDLHVSLGEEVVIAHPLVTLIDEAHLQVVIAIPENEYTELTEGDSAWVDVPALDNIRLKAVITEIGVNSTSLSHSYMTTLKLCGMPDKLKAGMACKVYLDTDLENRFSVPASVIKIDEGGHYVWVVNSENKVEKRRVRTGGFIDRGVAVNEGLSDGDKVIAEGVSKVSTGMKVVPQSVSFSQELPK